MRPAAPPIQVTSLGRRFKDLEALQSLSFAVAPGEIFGFLGPNGAGKTTTIRILTGQIPPSSGKVTVCGHHPFHEREAVARKIGVVFEEQNLYPRLSVRENLLFFARLFRVEKETIEILAEEFSFQESLWKPASSLSKGMRQRVLLARALLHSPQLLFLDEPTGGLDPLSSVAMREKIKELSSQGTTIFLTTHDMKEAEILCHRIAIIHKGRLLAIGAPHALISEFLTPESDLEDLFLTLTASST